MQKQLCSWPWRFLRGLRGCLCQTLTLIRLRHCLNRIASDSPALSCISIRFVWTLPPLVPDLPFVFARRSSVFPRALNTPERCSLLRLMQNFPSEATSTGDHKLSWKKSCWFGGWIYDLCQKHPLKNPHAEEFISAPPRTRWGDGFQQISTQIRI